MMRLLFIIVISIQFAWGQVWGWSIYDWQRTVTLAQVQDKIKKGADINARSKYGMTVLMYAAVSNKHSGFITVLLKAGADINAKDISGKTALIWAVAPVMLLEKSPPIIKALSKPGPDANRKALRDVVKVLLNAGADPNARDKIGNTALMYAAIGNKNPKAIKALLDAGADPKLTNKNGKTALDYVKDNAALKDSKARDMLKDAANK